MRNILIPGIVLCALACGTGAIAQTVTEPQSIGKAIEELGSKNFAQRQLAMEYLWQAGREAEPALERALNNPDLEIAFRARSLLERFRLGIYPDTPAEVIKLVNSFRAGDFTVKQVALKKLEEQGGLRTILALLRSEPNVAWRESLLREFTSRAAQNIQRFVAAGEYEAIREILELASTDDAGMRNYAAFLSLQGKLDDKIEQVRLQLRDADDARKSRLLVYLLRAKGDLTGALEAAAFNDYLGPGVLYELKRWETLSARQNDARLANARLAQDIEFLSYTAAYNRLAGKTAALEKDLAAIKQITGDDPQQSFYCAEALLINDRPDEAIETLKRHRPGAAFRLLVAQLRIREAFKLEEDLGAPGDDHTPWFKQLALDAVSADDKLRARFGLGLDVARALARLGQREAATRGFNLLAAALETKRDGKRLATLCQAEMKGRLVDLAFEHGALALSIGPEDNALDYLFADDAKVARFWWKFLRDRKPDQPHGIALATVRELMTAEPKVPEEANAFDWRPFVVEAEQSAAALEDPEKSEWLNSIGETRLIQGDRQGAMRLLAEAADSSAAAALRLGDLGVEDKDFAAAIGWYEKAADDDEQKPLAIYMQGWAMVQAGDTDAGAKQIQLARLLPLASGARRRALAEGLKQRKLIDQAVAEWEFILRTTGFRDWYSSNAAMNIGNAVSGKDYLRAADHWEVLSLSVLKTASSFLEVEGYLQLPHLVHKSRARGLLQKGKKQQAVKEMWASHTAFPGSVQFAEDLIPELEAADLRHVADELFEKTYQANDLLCQDFPNNAAVRNNLAWLAARAGRRLEDALRHANQAVELEPENAAYIDTLAESHFRIGNRQKAIELCERCLRIEPGNDHFLEQLKRFSPETP